MSSKHNANLTVRALLTVNKFGIPTPKNKNRRKQNPQAKKAKQPPEEETAVNPLERKAQRNPHPNFCNEP